MTRMLIAACGLMVATSTMSAQPPQEKPMPPKDQAMMKKELSVTGCVAATPDGQFMLTNATTPGNMKAEATKSDMSKGMTMSYDLKGGTLKPHVGHKVEVTGSMAPPAGMKGDNMAQMERDKTAKMDHKMGTIEVTSVKMVAATCP